MHAMCEQTLTRLHKHPRRHQWENQANWEVSLPQVGDIILHNLQNPPTSCDFEQYRPDLAIQIERQENKIFYFIAFHN